jgi:hypothetical protein
MASGSALSWPSSVCCFGSSYVLEVWGSECGREVILSVGSTASVLTFTVSHHVVLCGMQTLGVFCLFQ